MNRRAFLVSAGGTTTVLAGCLGGGSETDSSSGTTDAGGQSIKSHPAAANLAAQPTLGSPDTAQHTIIAFKDPSCSRCRVFKQSTVPEIRSELVSPDKAAYVLRNYPVVRPWGESATQALEAAADRSVPAHWQLERYYYDVQQDISSENVLKKTRTFLESNTDLTASDVISDVKADAYGDAISADQTAGERAGINNTTPAILLFRDGEFVTTATGSVSYNLIATALGES